MKTKLIKIGKFFGIVITDELINQYGLAESVEIELLSNGILIKSKKKAREGWEEQFEKAIAEGQFPEDELLEGF